MRRHRGVILRTQVTVSEHKLHPVTIVVVLWLVTSVSFDGRVRFGKKIFSHRVKHYHVARCLRLLPIGIVFKKLTHGRERGVGVAQKMMKHAEVVQIIAGEWRARCKYGSVLYRQILLLLFRLRFELWIVWQLLLVEFLVLSSEIAIRVFVEFVRRACVRFGVNFRREALSKRRHCYQEY